MAKVGAALGSIINEVRKEHLRTCVEKKRCESTTVTSPVEAAEAAEAAQS